MFDIELAKLPPPTPDHSAMSWKAHSGQSLVLQRDAGADGRREQHRCGQEDGVAPAGQANQERGWNTHRRAGDAGDRGQREQFGLGKRETQVQHLHGDDAPHAPDGEAAQQSGHRDPQVAVGDSLALRLPE
ncbi:hypothetical protein [Candidatus Accumulibacter necessarius]|uniref:hypothetical protein n=1 Tax=Candidatus Accumulibacter necessarius TaxID=2954386 RepID=UPI003DA7D35E